MSTSLMYHGFGLVGYKYLKTEYKKGCIYFHIQKDFSKLECPDCGSSNVIRRGTKMRTFKTVPIGKKSVFLVVKIQRVECLDCGCIKQEKLNFACLLADRLILKRLTPDNLNVSFWSFPNL